MVTEAEEVLARVKIALGMLPYVVDVPITDSEIVEIAEHAPAGAQLHSAFVAREFILERQAWIPLGDKTSAEVALRPLAQAYGCQLNFAGEAFLFFKERGSRPSNFASVGSTSERMTAPNSHGLQLSDYLRLRAGRGLHGDADRVILSGAQPQETCS